MKYYVKFKVYQPSTRATIVLLIVFACVLVASQMHASAKAKREEIQHAVLLGGSVEQVE